MTLNYPVLRVTQLDTAELDSSLLSTIKHSINQDLVRYLQSTFFQKYHAEIFAALKFVLWYHSFGKNNQTVGQSAFGWTYASSPKIKLVQKTLHAIVFCFDEWIRVRLGHFLKKFANYLLKNESSNEETSSLANYFNKLIDKLILLIDTVALLNYILFLYDGKFLSWWERLLQMRPVYTKAQFMRETNSESSLREELWHAYFSFFKATDSAFNLSKIFKKFKSNIETKSAVLDQSSKLNNLILCGICGETPTMAHCSVATVNFDQFCPHVFCYSCIKRNLSKEFKCPLCLKVIVDIQLYCKNENFN